MQNPVDVPAAVIGVEGLRKSFPLRSRGADGRREIVRAVDGVSFDALAGETLAIVGESGCGKSTTARLMVKLIEPDAGMLRLDGGEVGKRGGLPLRAYRQAVQMVFQDSYASLNPRLTLSDAVSFGPRVNGVKGAQAVRLAEEALERVGLDPRNFADRFPHMLSGGQRQRVNIARAIAMRPRVVILDEPVSALDKSVEAQVLNLLRDLKREYGLTYIFITHDLNVVEYIAERVLVMYLGRVVESGPVRDVFARPAHPYTRGLLASRLSMDPDARLETPPLSGDPPNPVDPPSGCRFRTRCTATFDRCAEVDPQLLPAADTAEHVVACLLYASADQDRAARAPIGGDAC